VKSPVLHAFRTISAFNVALAFRIEEVSVVMRIVWLATRKNVLLVLKIFCLWMESAKNKRKFALIVVWNVLISCFARDVGMDFIFLEIFVYSARMMLKSVKQGGLRMVEVIVRMLMVMEDA
jgi:hypothetical protein